MISARPMNSNQIPSKTIYASAGTPERLAHETGRLTTDVPTHKWREFLLLLLALMGLCIFAAESFGQQVTSSSEVSYLGATSQRWSGLSTSVGASAMITLDHHGNIIIADPTNGVVNLIPILGGSQKLLINNVPSITAIASDAQGTVFIASKSMDHLIKIPSGSSTSINIGSGLSGVSGLTVDQQGDVIAADAGNNRVVSIATSGTESVLRDNMPGLTAVYCDPRNSLYVANSAGITAYWFNGQVYQIGQSWSQPTSITEAGNANLLVVDSGKHQLIEVSATTGKETVLSLSTDPRNIVSITGDTQGDLFAYDTQQAQIMKVDYQINFGSVPVGSQSTSYTLNYQFQETTALAQIATVTEGALDGQMSVTGGTCIIYYTYTNGEACSVVVTITPKYAGAWTGDVTLIDTSGNNLIDVEAFGTGLAPSQVLLPGRAQTYYQNPYSYTGELIPSALAVDARENLYIGDDANARVLEVGPAGNSQVVFTGTQGHALGDPLALTLDGKGDLYIADASLAWGLSPNLGTPGTLRSNVFFAIPYGQWGGGQQFVAYMTGLAVQPDGGFYFSDSGNNRVVAVDNTGSGVDLIPASLPIGSSQQPLGYPLGLAYGTDGSLLVVDFDNSRVVKRSPTGVISEAVAPGVDVAGMPLNAPMGIAVDSAGNIYISDAGNNRIVGVTPEGNSWTVLDSNSTIDGTSSVPLNEPQTLAIDVLGNLFVADVGNERVLKLDRSTQNIVFDTTDPGKVSAPATVNIQNIGNESLTLNSFAIASSSTEFALASDTTCANTMTLAPDATCKVGINFSPTAAGSFVGSLSIISNTQSLNGTVSTVTLAGSTYAVVDHFTIDPLPSTVTAGDSFSYMVTAVDIHGNPVSDYRGTVKITWSNGPSSTSYSFQASDAGAHTFSGQVLTHAGITTLTVQDQSKSSLTAQGSVLVYAAEPVSLAISSGSGQSTVVKQSFNQPLAVNALDVYGNLVAGAAISFTAPSNGASAVDTDSTFPISTFSDSTGGVSINVNANDIPGSYSVSASLSNHAAVSFHLTNVAASAPTDNGGFTLSAQPSVTAFDGNGEAVSQLLILPAKDFAGTITLNCIAPADVDCTMDSTSVHVPGGATASRQIGVLIKKSTAVTAAMHQDASQSRSQIVVAIALLGGMFGFGRASRRRWEAILCTLSIFMLAFPGLIGCGSSYQNPETTAAAQVTKSINVQITAQTSLAGSVLKQTATITIEPSPVAGVGRCVNVTEPCRPLSPLP